MNGGIDMKKKRWKVIILILALPVLLSTLFFIRQYLGVPLICHLKSNEFTVNYDQPIDNQLSSYFENYEGNRTFDTSDLNFNEAKDYEVKIRCGLLKSKVTFHVVDQIDPVIKILSHNVDLTKDQDFSGIYEIEEISAYQVETNLDFEQLTVGLHNLCITVIDEFDNEASECTPIHVSDESSDALIEIDDLESTITAYLDMMNIQTSEIAISYQNLITGETYLLNENQYMFAASLYKLPLAMLYYDEIAAGNMTLDQELLFREENLELGGPTAYTYPIGSWLRVEDLLYNAIVYSDNSAARILYDGVGGWEQFKTKIKKYSDMNYELNFYNNEFTTFYLNDVLSYLYENSEHYSSLIGLMSYVYPDDYLNRYVSAFTVQKYGNYDTVQNVAGIVYTHEPYAVSIMCDVYQDGIDLIGRINEILYSYNLR